jgi:tetratricopeptide (TPR) repeat protein
MNAPAPCSSLRRTACRIRASARLALMFVTLVWSPSPRAAEAGDITNAPVLAGAGSLPVSDGAPTAKPATTNSVALPDEINAALSDSRDRLSTTNLTDSRRADETNSLNLLQQKIDQARQSRLSRQGESAVPDLVSVLKSPTTPDVFQRTAMLELALIAQDQYQLAKALQIFAQYLARWPDDPSGPEVLLREGLIYRQMGLNQMALTKFYAVMSTALVLKSDQFDYYRRLVLQSQTEIAETYYQQGKHQDAVEFLTRLLKTDHPALNRAQVHFKLIRSLHGLEREEEAVAQSQAFLERYAGSPEQPEVRFLLALALKKQGRGAESLQQVLLLLHETQPAAVTQPQAWAYWQKRAGNEIANQFYREGSYTEAITIYEQLACLDESPPWQVPVWYQMGISYEKLEQPGQALQAYDNILRCEKLAGSPATPQLKTIFAMARWRKDFLDWHAKADNGRRERKLAAVLAPTNGPPVIAARTEP